MDHLGDNGRISADIIGKDRTGFLVSLDFTCFPGPGFVGFTGFQDFGIFLESPHSFPHVTKGSNCSSGIG